RAHAGARRRRERQPPVVRHRDAVIGARGIELAWSEHAGRECLRVLGSDVSEIRDLAGLEPAELNRRLELLPSALVTAAAGLREVQPLAGRFEFDGDVLWFIP